MDANRREFSEPHSELTYQIVGGAFEVLNELGHGLLEKPYENALALELSLRAILVDQQKPFQVKYKGQEVGFYIPDLIVAHTAIVDTKIIDAITNIERAKMLNYLRITGLSLGLILNFKRPKLEWERIILEKKS